MGQWAVKLGLGIRLIILEIDIHRTAVANPPPHNIVLRSRHQLTLDAPDFNHFQPNSRHQANRKPATAKKKSNKEMRPFWIQSKSLACDGPRPSGNITNSAVASLPFRCASILSISPVVRHSLFNAAVRRLDNDLDLPRAPLAGLDGAAYAPSPAPLVLPAHGTRCWAGGRPERKPHENE